MTDPFDVYSLVTDNIVGTGSLFVKESVGAISNNSELISRRRARTIDTANLYRSLRKLERNGQVAEVEERAATDDGRRRRYYRLTPLGSEVLIAEAGRLVRLADAARARNLVPDAGGTP